MQEFNKLGILIIYVGLMITALGGLIYFLGGNLSWLGHLPGDIKIERENFTLYFPLSTMILISVILNVVLRIIRYFFH
jgi:hypothetical protein